MKISESLARSVNEDIDRLIADYDDDELIVAAVELNEVLLAGQARLASERRRAVRSMRRRGFTLQAIADLTGLTVPRIHQIEYGYGRKDQKKNQHPRLPHV
jgi:DNA-directed RNA polymerase specialized sigma24 family protein